MSVVSTIRSGIQRKVMKNPFKDASSALTILFFKIMVKDTFSDPLSVEDYALLGKPIASFLFTLITEYPHEQ